MSKLACWFRFRKQCGRLTDLLFLCRDHDLLDSDIPTPTVAADALIDVAKIQALAETLKDSTAFLADLGFLSEEIPVVKTTVNELVAGADRTMADLFDITGE